MSEDVQTKVNEMKELYEAHTFLLNQYNEIYSTNKYIEKTASAEKQKLEDTFNRLRSTLLRLKQEYLMKKFSVEEYSVRVNILHITLVLVCIMFILFILYIQNQLGAKLLQMILIPTIIVFVLLVILIVKSNSYRVETNWDKYYWGPIKKER
jgi:cytochrome c oxidase subunit IV